MNLYTFGLMVEKILNPEGYFYGKTKKAITVNGRLQVP